MFQTLLGIFTLITPGADCPRENHTALSESITDSIVCVPARNAEGRIVDLRVAKVQGENGFDCACTGRRWRGTTLHSTLPTLNFEDLSLSKL
jgi:hypothetical protein